MNRPLIQPPSSSSARPIVGSWRPNASRCRAAAKGPKALDAPVQGRRLEWFASDEESVVGATKGPATESSQPLERGLSVLAERPFKLGWVAIFDVVSTGERLVAVGYAATYERSHGAAWTSTDGRTWKKTHRLAPWYFHRAIPIADGAVLASRGTSQGCSRLWRLEPGGQLRKAELIWPSKRGCGKRTEVVALVWVSFRMAAYAVARVLHSSHE